MCTIPLKSSPICPIILTHGSNFHPWLSTTVPLCLILRSHYPNRQSAEGRRAKFWMSAYCQFTSAPIWAEFLVGRRLICQSTQVKSFVDRSADFQGFCHQWSFGGWPPDDWLMFWRNFHHDIGQRSPDHWASIGGWSPDGRSMTFYQRIISRQTYIICRWSPDSQNVARLSSDCRSMDYRWSNGAEQKGSNELCMILMWMRVIAWF